MQVSVEKPGSPAEILEHHGVKGMHWGIRKSPVRSATRAFNKKNPTGRARARDIRRARANVGVQYTKYKDTPRGPARKKAKLVYLRSPDRATALRMTRGEKATSAILAGAFAIPSYGAVPLGVAIGDTGLMTYRHYIEKKQARGGYK